jgi:hypothetical protein
VKKYYLSDLMNFDNQLFVLANYEAAEGLIPIFKTEEETAEYRAKVANIFNGYKLGIQNGEYNLDFVTKTVMGKYGTIPQLNLTPEEMVDNLIEGKDMCQIQDEPYQDTLADIMSAYKKRLNESNEHEDEQRERDEYDEPDEFYDELGDPDDGR